MALDARVSISAVLEEAGVSRGAFYRWKREDGNVLPLTKVRLVDAANRLKCRNRAREIVGKA